MEDKKLELVRRRRRRQLRPYENQFNSIESQLESHALNGLRYSLTGFIDCANLRPMNLKHLRES